MYLCTTTIKKYRILIRYHIYLILSISIPYCVQYFFSIHICRTLTKIPEIVYFPFLKGVTFLLVCNAQKSAYLFQHSPFCYTKHQIENRQKTFVFLSLFLFLWLFIVFEESPLDASDSNINNYSLLSPFIIYIVRRETSPYLTKKMPKNFFAKINCSPYTRKH